MSLLGGLRNGRLGVDDNDDDDDDSCEHGEEEKGDDEEKSNDLLGCSSERSTVAGSGLAGWLGEKVLRVW